MRFKLACIQFAPKKRQIASNLDRISELTLQAANAGADLALFPETATSGYFLEGGVIECAMTAEELQQELSARLESLNRPIDMVVGLILSQGGELYNAAIYFEAQPGGKLKVLHVYRKFFLPTYGVFDEERFVGQGRQLGVFDTRFGRVGILICEDVWHSMLPTLCAIKGAQLLLVPSASPGRDLSGEKPGNLMRYEEIFAALCKEHNVFVAHSSLCGFEGGKGFPGGSTVFGPMGELIAEGPLFDEHILLAEIDMDALEIVRANSPLLSDLRANWADLARIAGEVGSDL